MSWNNVEFKDESHKEYYLDALQNAKEHGISIDGHLMSLFYVLGLNEATGERIDVIYDFQDRVINPYYAKGLDFGTGIAVNIEFAFRLFTQRDYDDNFSWFDFWTLTSDSRWLFKCLGYKYNLFD
jgi:hypothetical protein